MSEEPRAWRMLAHWRWASKGDKKLTVWEWLEAWYVPMPVWRAYSFIKNPRPYIRDWKLARACPGVGGEVLYHYEGPYKVVEKDGDDLVLEKPDGGRFHASWLNCCDPVGSEIPPWAFQGFHDDE